MVNGKNNGTNITYLVEQKNSKQEKNIKHTHKQNNSLNTVYFAHIICIFIKI